MTTNVFNLVPHNADKPVPAEAYFISALIDSGIYLPSEHGISDRHYWAYRKVHEYCKDHQEHAGKAPAMSVVKSKYPSFPYVSGCDLIASARDLDEDARSRGIRSGVAETLSLLSEGEVDKAQAALAETVKKSTPARTKGVSMTDPSVFEVSAHDKAPISLDPSDTLQRTSGGIGPGNLYYIAARLEVGKSWVLQNAAVAAAEAGWDVNFYSLEMTAKEVIERLHRVVLRGHKDYYQMSLTERLDLVTEWQSRSGHIEVYDPSRGVVSSATIAGNHYEGAIACVDYVGLMRTNAGARAIEDWRAAATCSNELKEAALAHQIPALSAAQINRSGGQSSNGPTTDHLAQADAIGQDADLVLTLKKESARVRIAHIAKNRHGASGRKWHYVIDPARGRFGDITTEQAHTLIAEDEIANEA